MKNPVKIGVDASTRDDLRALKKGGDTFDDVVRRLMKIRKVAELEIEASLLKDLLDIEEETHILGPNDLCPLGWAWLIGDCDCVPDSGNCDDCERELAPIMKEED